MTDHLMQKSPLPDGPGTHQQGPHSCTTTPGRVEPPAGQPGGTQPTTEVPQLWLDSHTAAATGQTFCTSNNQSPRCPSLCLIGHSTSR